jgi:fatty-acyl-CoA synthase
MRGDHETLHRVIGDLRRADRSMTFIGSAQATQFSYEELGVDVRRTAGALRACGCQPADRVVLILPDGEQFLHAFFGAIWAGIVPVPLYPPFLFQQIDAYVGHVRRVVDQCGAKLVVTSGPVAALLGARDADMPLIGYEELPAGDEEAPARAEGRSMAFIQYTSGSTSTPKGVVVTHRGLLTNAERLSAHMRLDADRDRGVSWLPLYHDMGLIGGMLVPLMLQAAVWYMSPLDFVQRPSSWCDLIHETRSTVQFAPNFAYRLLAQRASDEELDRWDLSAWRVAGCGAEPIRADVIRGFQARFARAGFRPEAMLPCYGLAEATLAVTLADLATPLRALTVDAETLRRAGLAVPIGDGAAAGTELVSCGKPLPEHHVRILSGSGVSLDDGMEGEIQVAGPCVMAGYFDDRQATAAALQGGWLRTGDLGFLFEGELYVTGRSKDVIVTNGRNGALNPSTQHHHAVALAAVAVKRLRARPCGPPSG